MRMIEAMRRRQCAVCVRLGALLCVSLVAWTGWAAVLETAAKAAETASALGGWTPAAPRDEIRPEFAQDPKGGPDGKGCLLIKADRRDGLAGYWTKTFP